MQEINSDDGRKRRMRNLRQNRGMSDEEFEEYWDKRVSNAEPSAELERRIQRKMDEYSKDYDLDDLKINDKAALRALIQAEIGLEDYEQIIFRIRQSGDLSQQTVSAMDRIGKLMTDLRGDISKLQADLNITRKIRKSDKEASVVNYIETLKQRARQFKEKTHVYVTCPKCNMLLFTGWFLYPDIAENKVTLVCKRVLADGQKCNTKVSLSSKELDETVRLNSKKVLPESVV